VKAIPFVFFVVHASDVVVLTDNNFDSELANGDWLLEFYAPWCGHCKRLAPIYEQVATELKGKINVGKIDCTVETGLAGRFEIKGYPTLKFASKGLLYEYRGDRSENALVKYAEGEYLNTPSAPIPGGQLGGGAGSSEMSDVVILTDSNFDQLTSSGKWLLEFYAPWCGHCKTLAPTYEQVATKLKGSVKVGKVDCTIERSLASRFKIRGFPTLKFLSNGLLYDYNGDRSVESFEKFVSEDYRSLNANPLPSPSDGDDGVMGGINDFFNDLGNGVWAIVGGLFILGIIIGGIFWATVEMNDKSE